MEYNSSRPKSTSRLLQSRSLDGLHFSNPGLRFFKDTISSSQSLYKRDLLGHFGCVNAIEFSPNGELIASGGDDRRLLLWNVWRTIFDSKPPISIETQHTSNINSVSFDCANKTVATGGSDGQVIVNDISTLRTTSVYDLHETIFCLSPDPINSTNIAIASDDGKIQILDTRLPADSCFHVIADLKSSMHSVMFNPSEPRFLATANSKHGISVWDVRKPRNVYIKSGVQNCMSVRFNSRGDQLLVLRRRGCPVVYDMTNMEPVCKFDYKTYYNACTLKSASFAGLQDEYVMSGSDDFCVYLWRIPDSRRPSYINTEPHMILKGHRSIVNQVRYCPYNQMVLSSGVEKLIKMWTPYALPDSAGRLRHSRRYGDNDEMERNAYSHEEYIHMVLRAGSFLSHDYSNGNTKEEPCMIAFFDSLIQREVEQSAEDSDYSIYSGNEQSAATDVNQLNEREVDTETQVVAALDRANSSERNGRVSNSVNRGSQRSTSSRRNETLNRRDDESSSDSASDVDEILSAMYNRYMHSRDTASDALGPSGNKISSVIAKKKHRVKVGKQRDVHQPEEETAGADPHSNGDIHHQDNSRSMSVLADVIDNFVDNLVASDMGSSQSLSDTNDSSMFHVSTSRTNNIRNSDILPMVDLLGGGDSFANSLTNSPPPSPIGTSRNFRSDLNRVDYSDETTDGDMYFVPELEVFSSQVPSSSFNSDSQRRNRSDSQRIRENGRKTHDRVAASTTKSRSFHRRRLSHRHKSRATSSSDSSDSDNDTESFKFKPPVSNSSTSSHKKRKNIGKIASVNSAPVSSGPSASNDSSSKRHSGKGYKSKIKRSKSTTSEASQFPVSNSPSPRIPPSTLPSSSSSHTNSSCRNKSKKSSFKYSNDTLPVNVREKKATLCTEDGDESNKANDASDCDTKGPVTFKKVKRSKGRRFRKRSQRDSNSSFDSS